MSSQQGQQSIRTGASAPHPPPIVVSARVPVTQQGHTNASTEPSLWSRCSGTIAPSVTPVAASLPLQHLTRMVPQASSSPASYADPGASLGTGSTSAAPFQVLASTQQQPQQAELHANRGEHLMVPPPLVDLIGESNNRRERSLIFQLRGLPFATTREDVEAFLRNVNYYRLDIGTLATGESSGNAFVELRDPYAAEVLGRLHNTIINVAADARVPARERPRPRYVEVLNADATRREDVLQIDAHTLRSALPLQRRARAAATAAAATNIASFPGVFTEAQQPQQLQPPTRQLQPLIFPQQQQQRPLAEFAQGDVRYFATPTVTPPSRPCALMPPVSSQRFMEFSRYGGSFSTSWSAYTLPTPQQPQSSSLLASSMPVPHFLGPPGATMAASSIPAMVHVQSVQGSGLARGATLAPLPLYQLVTPIAPQTQAMPQQRAFTGPNVSYFVFTAVSAPSPTLVEAQNTYYVAATSSTEVAASSGCYYVDGSNT